MTRRAAVAGCLARAVMAVAVSSGGPALADITGRSLDGLDLGATAASLPSDVFAVLACGTDGGPPGKPIARWSDFATCPPDKRTGLHEVYFEFDDELEYVGRALDNQELIDLYRGTTLGGHPVVLSLLFDSAGAVAAVRIVTDSRAGQSARRAAYALGDRLMERYGPDGWTCRDVEATAGETPIGGRFIKRRCEKTGSDRRFYLAIDFFRRAGQLGVVEGGARFDPSGFTGSTRAEIVRSDLALPPLP